MLGISQEASQVYSENINDGLRSIFINYQIIKYLKITEKTKVLLAYEIKSGKYVTITISKLQNDDHSFNLTTILNHKLLPKVFLNQKFGNYHILIQKAYDGVSLIEIKINMKDALKIFAQIVKLTNYLFKNKIKMTDLSLEYIFIDKNQNISFSETDWIKFNDENENSEDEFLSLLLKILDYLHFKSCDNLTECKNNDILESNYIFNNSIKNECANSSCLNKNESVSSKCFNMNDYDNQSHSKIISIDSKSENLFKLIKTLKSISEILNVLGISQNPSSFKNISVIDPLVLYHIDQLDYKPFNPFFINDKSKNEYFVYRLVNENVVRAAFKTQFREIASLLNKEKRMKEAMRSSIHINKIENSIFLALSKKEDLKKEIIKKRMEFLNEEYSWSFWRYFGCTDERSILTVFILDSEKIDKTPMKKIIKKNDELVVSGVIKENKIVFNKEKGKSIDFKYLVSEFIENTITF